MTKKVVDRKDYIGKTWDEITDSCEYIDEAYDELGNMWSLFKDTEKGVYLLSPYSGKLKDVNIEKE